MEGKPLKFKNKKSKIRRWVYLELAEMFSSDDLKNGLEEKDQFVDMFSP
jgi:hypothetical protein